MTKLENQVNELNGLAEGLPDGLAEIFKALTASIAKEAKWTEQEPAALADQILDLRTRIRIVTAELNKSNADLSRALGKVDDLTSTVAGLRAELAKRS